MRDALEKAGHKVFEAENGTSALELLEKNTAELIATDIIMPETDGIEIIRTLRLKNPKTPIIAISGGGRIGYTDYLPLAKKLGASLVLAKPFRRQELIDAVQSSLGVGD
jgi:CheY-like chemotaxis protein